MSEILYGAPVAGAIHAALYKRVERLRENGVQPRLAILRAGERSGAIAYERTALKSCDLAGVRGESIVLPEESATEDLLAELDRINADPEIHGCLILRPMPGHVDSVSLCRRLLPEKDVDGVTDRSVASVFLGKGDGYCPCTAEACAAILEHYGFPVSGKHVVVIGRSLIVGRPLSMLMTARDATVTLCHSRTQDLPAICRGADVLISATGHAGLVDDRFVREGQIVLDVGTFVRKDGHLCGDVAFERVSPIVKAISPVPKGVGAVTTAVLARHVIEAAEKRLQECK